jgi:hypothetical protein
MDEKVIPINRKQVLFTENQRQGIHQTLSTYTDRPDEAVNAVEVEFCRQLISAFREIATNLGNQIGDWIGKKLLK